MYSHLIRGARVMDGSGAPPSTADVAVCGGLIAAVGSGRGPAETEIDAGGLVLAPGFIDIHGHSDMTLFRHPLLESKVFQGVTTEVTGNCGLSPFPVAPVDESTLGDYLRMHDFLLPAQGFLWSDFASYADFVDSIGLAINVAPLCGHAPLRAAAMGMDDRPATPAELARMNRLLREALRQGAWGMSTGLIYPPGSYADTVELVALSRTLREVDAPYASHIRGEGEGIASALDEACAVARGSGARVQVSHLKAMGRGNRGRGGELLAKLEAARASGLRISADQYPYAASGTCLSAMIPQWAHDGGVARLLERLREPRLRERLLPEIREAIDRREGAGGIMIANCRSPENRRYSGSTLDQVAAGLGCTAEEAVIRLVLEEDAAVGAIFFSMAEEDVESILADPRVAVGSDGHGLCAEGQVEATHPRSYGTYPRVLGRYVRERKVLSLETAVHKMTGLPAAILGFTDRGLIREGYAADLVLFDPATVADLSTWTDPHRYSTGIVHLLVGGVAVVRDGRLTGRRPGRVLRRTPKP
ncbi:MAG TPA: D-aminoacylase [Verrucomicrobiae bacterium]|nr:D-aminoacylase [Verrucomicrobiae bacterium]